MARNKSRWSDGSGWKIKSNPTWQEVEVDNLMKMDETADHHLKEEVDLMEVDEVTDWWKRLDDLVTKHLDRTKIQSEQLKKWGSQLVPKRSLI